MNTKTPKAAPKRSARAAEAAEPRSRQICVRLPIELVRRLDAHHARLAAERPALGVSRADAVRVLLTSALDEAEGAT